MEQQQRKYRAFESSLEAQAFVPGFNAEFNDYIRSQTVIPVTKIGRNVALDPFKAVTALVHQYDGTPGKKATQMVIIKRHYCHRSNHKDLI